MDGIRRVSFEGIFHFRKKGGRRDGRWTIALQFLPPLRILGGPLEGREELKGVAARAHRPSPLPPPPSIRPSAELFSLLSLGRRSLRLLYVGRREVSSNGGRSDPVNIHYTDIEKKMRICLSR